MKLGLLVLTVAACGGGLAVEDVDSLVDAQRLNLRAYEVSDGGAVRAFSRAAFCSVAAVLRRQDAGPIDAGDTITCGARP